MNKRTHNPSSYAEALLSHTEDQYFYDWWQSRQLESDDVDEKQGNPEAAHDRR